PVRATSSLSLYDALPISGGRALYDPRHQQRRHRADRPARPHQQAAAAVRTGHPGRRRAAHAGPDALPALARLAHGAAGGRPAGLGAESPAQRLTTPLITPAGIYVSLVEGGSCM